MSNNKKEIIIRAAVLGEGRDIIIGETWVPTSLNINNLGEAAALHFPLLWPGLCLSQPIDKILGKAAELHLTLTTSSFHRLLIICSPQSTCCSKMSETFSTTPQRGSPTFHGGGFMWSRSELDIVPGRQSLTILSQYEIITLKA
jgi:hypothetical protein